jgi:adenosylhomocysteine nucleosidase
MATPSEELIAAVNADDATRVAELVAEDPSLAATRDLAGVSAVMLSRYRFNRATTEALLVADPDLDVFEATALGYIDRLREALTSDPASANAYSPDGFTALHYAGFFGKVEAARELIAAGAAVDAYTTNAFANQPLHAAAAGRHLEVCRLLLGAGADVNATQHAGYTPLHEAAQSGDVELAELFLSAGADPSATNEDGQTPAETAESAGHPDLAARIREVAEAR